jgi:hypothetical protein
MIEKMYTKKMRFRLPTALRVTTANLRVVTPSSLVGSGQMAAISSKISANSTSSHGATFQKITFSVGKIYYTIRQFGTKQYARE